MTRRYGRAPRGRRVDAAVPHGFYKSVTLTAAVRLDGVGACLAFDGATNAACFGEYVDRALAPTLRRGDIVVMDNLACHKSEPVAATIRAAGAEVRCLPAYSPDLNPIEKMFSELKESLRSAEARTVEAVYEAMGEGLRTVTRQDIAGWFESSGYRYEQA